MENVIISPVVIDPELAAKLKITAEQIKSGLQWYCEYEKIMDEFLIRYRILFEKVIVIRKNKQRYFTDKQIEEVNFSITELMRYFKLKCKTFDLAIDQFFIAINIIDKWEDYMEENTGCATHDEDIKMADNCFTFHQKRKMLDNILKNIFEKTVNAEKVVNDVFEWEKRD